MLKKTNEKEKRKKHFHQIYDYVSYYFDQIERKRRKLNEITGSSERTNPKALRTTFIRLPHAKKRKKKYLLDVLCSNNKKILSEHSSEM